MIAAHLALALDAVRCTRAARIEPDNWQADLLRSMALHTLLGARRPYPVAWAAVATSLVRLEESR